MGTPIGGASLMRGGVFPSFGVRERAGMIGPIRGMDRPRLGIMPTRIGSPFRQPPSLSGGGGGAMGSM